MSREYSETQDARILLRSPANPDYKLFEVYSLLGCYILLCSDLSELLALSRAKSIQGGVPFGADGWMDDVEYMKKHRIDPILTRAAEFVQASLFKMPNIPLLALYQPGELAKLQQKINKGILAANVGQIGQRAISAFVIRRLTDCWRKLMAVAETSASPMCLQARPRSVSRCRRYQRWH